MKAVGQGESFRYSKQGGNLVLLGLIVVWAFLSQKLPSVHVSIPYIAQLTPTKIQVIAFPFVLLLLWRLFLFRKRIPKVALLFAVLGAAIGVGYSYSHVSLAEHPVLVAQVNGDELEVETSLLREAINSNVMNSTVHAIRHYTSIRSHRDAVQLLEEKKELQGLVWGDLKLLHITFPKHFQAFPLGAGIEAWTKATQFQLVTSVPEIILPFKPKSDSAEYIGNLFSALPQLSHDQAEMFLKSSATQWGRWKFKDHLGYSWWLLGNLYLTKALEGGDYKRAELLCAISAYSRARKLVTLKSHPELAAAILNNRAFAHYVQGIIEGKKSLRKFARKELRVAAGTHKIKNPLDFQLHASKVSRQNARLFKRQHADKAFFRPGKKKLEKLLRDQRHR